MEIVHATANAAARIVCHLAAGENVTSACRLAGIGRKTYYRWRAADLAIREDFQKAWEAGAEKRRFLGGATFFL